MEGARISWDELTCVGYEVTEEATQSLCKDIEDFRKKAGLSGHDVRKEQLFNWKILKKSEGNVLASNAYVLLTSDYFRLQRRSAPYSRERIERFFLINGNILDRYTSR